MKGCKPHRENKSLWFIYFKRTRTTNKVRIRFSKEGIEVSQNVQRVNLRLTLHVVGFIDHMFIR